MADVELARKVCVDMLQPTQCYIGRGAHIAVGRHRCIIVAASDADLEAIWHKISMSGPELDRAGFGDVVVAPSAPLKLVEPEHG